MNERKKWHGLMILLVMIAVLCCCSFGVSAASVTISVDKATLGQGWLLPPTKVEIESGDTVADVTIKAMGKNNVIYDSGNTYLSFMRDESDTQAVFPQYIIDAVNLASNYREGAETMNADGRNREGWLGEFDYYNMSGWMVTVNNFFIDNSTGAWKVSDGDVIRWQFTVYGYGRDIGENKVDRPLVPLIDKDALCRKVAEINQDKESYVNGDIAKQRYYDNANRILTTTTATKEQVDMVLANLNGTSAAEPTLPDPNYVAGDAAAVADVEAKISAIGTVTLASKEDISAARKAYDSLLRRLRGSVSNYAVLTAAEAKYDQLVQQAADDQLAAENVTDKIAAIGPVTLDRKEAIETARSAYDKLTAAQKNLVTNYATLTAAETRLAKLEKEAAENQAAADAVTALIQKIGTVTADSGDAITAARSAYDKLSTERKALVTNVETLTKAEAAYAAIEDKIANAEAKIDAIGAVTLSSKNAIAKARAAFDALSAAERKYVANYGVLTAAEAAYAALEEEAAENQAAADSVMTKISAIGTVTAESGEKISAARKAYDALTAEQKKLVINIDTLRKAETRYAELSGNSEELIAATEKAIEDIGTVSLDSGAAIAAARESYDALTANQKKNVSNYAKLLSAEMKYANLTEKAKQDQAAADEVKALIDAIGEVTLNSKTAIDTARNGYNGLTAAQKKLVTNDQTLTEAEAKYNELKAADDKAKADAAAAKKVIDKINAIGTVTLNSKNAIDAARTAYTGLTVDQKKLISNYNTLTAAETRYNDLKAADDKAKADAAAAKAVTDQISAIGTVTLSSKNAIDTARNGYDGLTADQKKLVTNYSTLTAAETRYAALLGQVSEDQRAAIAVDDRINAIGTVTLDSKTAIAAARSAYNGLTADQKKLVVHYAKLTAAESKYAELVKEREDAEKAAAEKAKADAAAAKTAADQISAIGTVTLDSKTDIDAARSAYDKLTADQKKLVANYSTLTAAEARYDALVKEKEAAEKAAAKVKTAIDAIGTVTKDSKTAIAAARSAYDKLTDAQKKLVDNIDTLLKAEASYAELAGENEKMSAAAEAAIESIGTVTLDSGDAIETARAMYNALTANQKTRVTNYAKLIAAETKYAELLRKAAVDQAAAAAVTARINEIGEVTLEKEETIAAARVAFDGLTDDQKALVDNEAALKEAEAKLAELKNQPAENPFIDVKEGAFCYDAVAWAVANGITNGTDATHFTPAGECTRGQVVTFLWRAAGSPKPTSVGNPFADVKEGKFYYKAVLWAVENGVTNGTDATHFSPDATCTRGQVVTFQWRAAGSPAPQGSNNPFVDVKAGAYYEKAVLWAVANGVTNGTDAAHFSPDDTCTRGQVVTFLFRDPAK
ncbi:MAG: S-layer homology domain-containing protein [Bacillota bacterium]|jgi:chromosome segregation ATPase